METHTDLVKLLAKTHGIHVSAVIRRRSVLGLLADDGQRYIWKPAKQAEDEKRLVALTQVYPIFQSCDVPAALPLVSRDGTVLVGDGSTELSGYLQQWLPGRHVNVKHPFEREKVVLSLARLHRASQAQNFPSVSVLNRGSFIHKLRLKERTVLRLWPVVERNYPTLRKWKRPLVERMAEVIGTYASTLQANGGVGRDELAFCHRDLAPHNALLQPDGKVSFIDFDHANYDDMLHDIVQFTSHCIFLERLTNEEVTEMLDLYASEARLSEKRQALLRALTKWPDTLIRALMDWYRQGMPQSGLTRVKYAASIEYERVMESPKFAFGAAKKEAHA